MARTRPLETYPTRFLLAAIRKAASKPFHIPCTQTEAASLRGEFNAWRRAVEAEPEQARDLGISAEEARSFRDLTFRVKPTGLEICPINELPSVRLIEAALGGEVPPIVEAPNPAAEALRRLQAGLAQPPEE